MSYDLIEITLIRVGEQLPDRHPLSNLVRPIIHQPDDARQRKRQKPDAKPSR
jgi:hypothetical protein